MSITIVLNINLKKALVFQTGNDITIAVVETAALATQKRISGRKWMDGWIYIYIYKDIFIYCEYISTVWSLLRLTICLTTQIIASKHFREDDHFLTHFI